jgi:probable phosphomutase (TIGR03848 family)
MPSTNSVIYLVRHAHSTANLKNVLAGQDNRVGLSDRGREEADLLSSRLSELDVEALICSPMLRCQESVASYLGRKQWKLKIDERINEMNYGSWSGKKLSKLVRNELWPLIQNKPTSVRFPEGESFLEMSARANQAVIDLANNYEKAILVSHGDVIKAVLAAQLGLSVDHLQKFNIDPASITAISISGAKTRLIYTNDTSHLRSLKQFESSKVNGKSGSKSTGYILGGGSGPAHKSKNSKRPK